jgi:hypothetical protein
MRSHTVQAKQFFRFIDHTLTNVIIRIQTRTYPNIVLVTIFSNILDLTLHEDFNRFKFRQF